MKCLGPHSGPPLKRQERISLPRCDVVSTRRDTLAVRLNNSDVGRNQLRRRWSDERFFKEPRQNKESKKEKNEKMNRSIDRFLILSVLLLSY